MGSTFCNVNQNPQEETIQFCYCYGNENSERETFKFYCCCENELSREENNNNIFFVNSSRENKISLKYKINNTEEKIRLFGSQFYNRNKDKCRMVIDFTEKDLLEFYRPIKKNEKELQIILEIKNDVTDISYMFDGCSSLISVQDINNLKINNITNISHVFSKCTSLEMLDISEWNVSNVTDISHLFSECLSLKYLADISKWNTANIVNMSYLFYDCSSLIEIPDISKWNIKNVKDFSYLFYGCSSLKKLPNISSWNTKSLENMSYIFYDCSTLNSLPDISKWKTNNVTNMSYAFYNCSSLKEIPDISEWKTDNVTNMKSMFSFLESLKTFPEIGKWNTKNLSDISNMFYGCSFVQFLPEINSWSTDNIINISYLFCKCSSLITLPNISSWRTNKVIDMSYMCYGCTSLTSMQDISNWKTNNVINMSYMFYNCSSIEQFPFISKWNTEKVTNMSYMFYNCSSLKDLDDISKWNTDKVTEITMIFYNCQSLNPLPDISKWKCYNNNNNDNNNITNKINNEYKIEVKGDIENQKLKMIPQIIFKFNNNYNYDEELMEQIKEELKKLLKTDKFSIVKFKKGSLTIAITLQYIVMKQLNKIRNAVNLADSFFEDINNEVLKCAEKIKEHNFLSLGTTKPDTVDEEVINIKENEKKEEIGNLIRRISTENLDRKKEDNNILEVAKTIKTEDIEKFFNNLSLEAEEQEINIKRFIKNTDKYNEFFDVEIEIAYKNSVFEYNIIHIFLVDKDDCQYQSEKKKCPNRKDRILFHGTKVDSATGILSNQFFQANCHIFGKGVYFTDILDYAWFYAGEESRKNFNRIPFVGDTFTCVASEIYYDKTKLETVYDCRKKDEEVEKNGIRCAFADYNSTLMSKNRLDGYKGFIGNEFLITDESQFLPIYGITLKRVEFLVVWRDINFNINNKNQYPLETFNEILNFHRKIINYIRREFNSRIYYIETTEEALELINRKKYNKIIIITNGNNDGQDFINQARQIIGSNAIAAVTAINIQGHYLWVKNMENVLLLNGMDFHIKFFNCIKMNDQSKYEELREEIIDHYKNKEKISDFNLSESSENLFNFPNFKNEGIFEDLNFDLKKKMNNAADELNLINSLNEYNNSFE